jgi:hypothetical protein
MTAQPRLGLARSWPRITSVFLIDVAALILATHLPRAPQIVARWVGVTLAAVTIAAVHHYLLIFDDTGSALWQGRAKRCAFKHQLDRLTRPTPLKSSRALYIPAGARI